MLVVVFTDLKTNSKCNKNNGWNKNIWFSFFSIPMNLHICMHTYRKTFNKFKTALIQRSICRNSNTFRAVYIRVTVCVCVCMYSYRATGVKLFALRQSSHIRGARTNVTSSK